MIVALLLALIWVAVLVPPAVRSHHARKKAFEVSFGRAVPNVAPAIERAPAAPGPPPPGRRHSPAVQRRRRIAGGLLIAMVASGLAGLLPTFRVFLVVNLFVDDSFLFYVTLLAYRADRRARDAARSAPAEDRPFEPAGAGRRSRRSPVPRGALLPDLPPVASIG